MLNSLDKILSMLVTIAIYGTYGVSFIIRCIPFGVFVVFRLVFLWRFVL